MPAAATKEARLLHGLHEGHDLGAALAQRHEQRARERKEVAERGAQRLGVVGEEGLGVDL